ncbi:MAG: ATPase, T2SS/T4P/T4SS family [Pseudomonadota bacterium]
MGRLVLSTLHVKSPEAARVRLMDLGVAEYLVEEVLVGVLGQRLEPPKGTNQCSPSENRTNIDQEFSIRLIA